MKEVRKSVKFSNFTEGLSSIQEAIRQNIQAYELWMYDTTKLVVHIKRDSKAMEEYLKLRSVLDHIFRKLDRVECQIVSMLEDAKQEGEIPFNARFPLEILNAIQNYLLLLSNYLGKPITERYDEAVPRIVLDYLAEYLLVFREATKILKAYDQILNRKNPDGTKIISKEYQMLERILKDLSLQLKFQTRAQHSKIHIVQTLRHCLWELKLAMLTNFFVQIKKKYKNTDDMTVFYEFDRSSAIDQNLADLVNRISDLKVSSEQVNDLVDYLNLWGKNNPRLSASLNIPTIMRTLQKRKTMGENKKCRFSVVFHEVCKDFMKLYVNKVENSISDPKHFKSSLNFADKFKIIYEDLFDPEIVEDRPLIAQNLARMLKEKIGKLFLLFLGEEEEDQQEWETLLEKLQEGDLECLANKDFWLLNEVASDLELTRRKPRWKEELKRLFHLYSTAIRQAEISCLSGTSEEIVRCHMALIDTIARSKPWIIESVENRLLYPTAIHIMERKTMMITPRQMYQAVRNIFGIELDWVITDEELKELLKSRPVQRQNLEQKKFDITSSSRTGPSGYPILLEQVIKESLRYDLLRLIPSHKLNSPLIEVRELGHLYKRLDAVDKAIGDYKREIERLVVSAKNMAEHIEYLELRLGEETIIRYLGPITVTQNLSPTQELIQQDRVPLEVKIISTDQDLREIDRFLISGSDNKMVLNQTWNLEKIEKRHHRYFVKADLQHEEENKEEDEFYLNRQHTIGSVMRQVTDALLTQQRIYQLAKEGAENLLILIPGVGFQSVPRYELPGWKILPIKTAGYPFGEFPIREYSQWVEVFLLKLENLRLLYKLIPEGRKVFVCHNLGAAIGPRILQTLYNQSTRVGSSDINKPLSRPSTYTQRGYLANGLICLDCPEADIVLMKDVAPQVATLTQSEVGIPLWKAFHELTRDPIQAERKGFSEVKASKEDLSEKRIEALTFDRSLITIHQFPQAGHNWGAIRCGIPQEGVLLETICNMARKEDLIRIMPYEPITQETLDLQDFLEQRSIKDEQGEIKQEFLNRALTAIRIRLEERQYNLLFHEICVYGKNSEYKIELKTRLGKLVSSHKPSEKTKAREAILVLFERFCQEEYKKALQKQLETLLDSDSMAKTRKAALEDILDILNHHFVNSCFTADDFLVFLNFLQETQSSAVISQEPIKTEPDYREKYFALFTKATFIQDKVVEPKSKEILRETFTLIGPFSKLLIYNPNLANSHDFSYTIKILISGIIFAMSAYNLKDMTIFSALKPELMAFKNYNNPDRTVRTELNYLLDAYKIILEHHKLLRRIAQLDSTLTIEDSDLEKVDSEISELLELEDRELSKALFELKTQAQALIFSGFNENPEELEQMIERVTTLRKYPTQEELLSDEEKLKEIGWKIVYKLTEREKESESLLSKTRILTLGKDATTEKVKKLEKLAQDILELKLKDLELKVPHPENMQEINMVLQRKRENLNILIGELREEQDTMNTLINRISNCPIPVKTWFKSGTYSKFSQLLDFFGRTAAKAGVITKSVLPEWITEYQALLSRVEAMPASREKNMLINQMLLIEARLRILENKFLETEQVKALLHTISFMSLRLEIQQIAILKGRVLELSNHLVPQLADVRSYYYKLRDHYYAHPEELEGALSCIIPILFDGI